MTQEGETSPIEPPHRCSTPARLGDDEGRRRSGHRQRQPALMETPHPLEPGRAAHDPLSPADANVPVSRSRKPAHADTAPLSVRPSFRLGDAGVLCTAQIKPTDPRLKGIFDRSYQLTCRDAAAPVGSVLARRATVDLAREPSALPVGTLACRAEESTTIDNVGTVRAITCRDEAAKLDYRRYAVQRGKIFYLAEGLAGYDPALKLAWRRLQRPGAEGRRASRDTTSATRPPAPESAGRRWPTGRGSRIPQQAGCCRKRRVSTAREPRRQERRSWPSLSQPGRSNEPWQFRRSERSGRAEAPARGVRLLQR